MPSAWTDHIGAVLRRELQTEFRSRQGVFASLLFGVLTTVAVSFTATFERPGANVAAGLLSVVLIFAGTVTVPRFFFADRDQGSLTLLLLLADVRAVYLGKALFAVLVSTVTSLVLGGMFVTVVATPVVHAWVIWAGLVVFGASTASVLSMTSALVMPSSGRWMMAGVAALPFLIPMVLMGLGTFRSGFGMGSTETAVINMLAVSLYGIGAAVLGPTLCRLVWTTSRKPRSAITGPDDTPAFPHNTSQVGSE